MFVKIIQVEGVNVFAEEDEHPFSVGVRVCTKIREMRIFVVVVVVLLSKYTEKWIQEDNAEDISPHHLIYSIRHC